MGRDADHISGIDGGNFDCDVLLAVANAAMKAFAAGEALHPDFVIFHLADDVRSDGRSLEDRLADMDTGVI